MIETVLVAWVSCSAFILFMVIDCIQAFGGVNGLVAAYNKEFGTNVRSRQFTALVILLIVCGPVSCVYLIFRLLKPYP